MTKDKTDTSIVGKCIALDGAICRQPLHKDGGGILCKKHLSRLKLGEDISISKQAGTAAAAILAKLNSELKGAEHLVRNNDESSDTQSAEDNGKTDAASQDGPKKSEKNSGDAQSNLMPFAVFSVIVAVYAALVLYFQAPHIQLPLGMTLSGFNSTVAALQALPHGLMVVLLSACLTILLCLAVSAILCAIVLMFLLFQLLLLIPLEILARLLNWVAIGKRLVDILRLRRGEVSKPGTIERLLQRCTDVVPGLEERRKRISSRIPSVFGFPFRVIYLGNGNSGRVWTSRLAFAALVLVLGIPLAIWSAQDRERHVLRQIATSEMCQGEDAATDCPVIQPHSVLDWADRISANAQQIPQPAALPWEDGVQSVAWAWTTENLPYYVNQTPFWIRELLRPDVVVGTFVYSSRDVAPVASHVMAHDETQQRTSFRTEELIHIGDYGQWIFVAKASPPDRRMLIRRSAMMEFSTSPDIGVVNPRPPGPLINQPDTDAVIAHLRRQNTDLAAQVSELQGHLAKMGAEAMAVVKVSTIQRFEWLAVKPILQSILLSGGGNSQWLDLGTLVSNGVSSRVPGIFDDLIRRHGHEIVERCRANHTALTPIPFKENLANWSRQNAPDAYKRALGHLKVLRKEYRNDSMQRLVILQGGASFTGKSASNMLLSEARAKWVQSQLLADLFADYTANAADLAARASADLGLHFVAFGMGERMTSTATSGRAVEIFACTYEAKPKPDQVTAKDIAQNN